MLEPKDIKKLVNSINTFENTKSSLEENEKNFLDEMFGFLLNRTEKSLEKVFGTETTINEVNTEIVNAGLLNETLNMDSYLMQDILVNSKLTTMLIDNEAVRKCSAVVTEQMESDEQLTMKELAAFNEILEQLMTSFTKSLSNYFDYSAEYEMQNDKASQLLAQENILQIAFSLKVSNVDTTIYYMISYEIINEIISLFAGQVTEKNKKSETVEDNLEESVATVQPIKFEEFTEAVLGSEKENM